jgi:hypothetical protein
MRPPSHFSTVLKVTMAGMKSPWHRNPSASSQALRFHGLLAASPSQGQSTGLPMRARWNQAQAVQTAPRRLRKASWLPRIAGLLAFCALAFGVMLAGSETCTAQETATSGSYGGSTLALITESRADAAARPHGGACKHQRKAGRGVHPKTVL